MTEAVTPEVRQQACDEECLDTCVVPCECICHQRAAVAGAPRPGLVGDEHVALLDAIAALTQAGYLGIAREMRALLARLTREEG